MKIYDGTNRLAFNNLGDGIVACVGELPNGNPAIVFPQNFAEHVKPGQLYDVDVRITATGKFEGQDGTTYRVCRAYSAEYNANGEPLEITASFEDKLAFAKKALPANNPFAEALKNVKKENLPVHKEIISKKGLLSSGVAVIGMKIVRPLNLYNTGEIEIGDIVPTESIRGEGDVAKPSYMVRAADVRDCLTSSLVAVDPKLKGKLVVFFDEPLTEDWIYINIRGKAANGKAVFGKPVNGTIEELKALYDLFPAKEEKVDEVATEKPVKEKKISMTSLLEAPLYSEAGPSEGPIPQTVESEVTAKQIAEEVVEPVATNVEASSSCDMNEDAGFFPGFVKN